MKYVIYILLCVIGWIGFLYYLSTRTQEIDLCIKSEKIIKITPVGHRYSTSYFWETENSSGNTENEWDKKSTYIPQIGEYKCVAYKKAVI